MDNYNTNHWYRDDKFFVYRNQGRGFGGLIKNLSTGEAIMFDSYEEAQAEAERLNNDSVSRSFGSYFVCDWQEEKINR